MMEYTSKYWNMLTPLIKKSLLKRYGKEETAELLRKTNQIYRDMLRRADDIGKDNPMASNLYEGLIFLALWDASDRQISVDELRTISEEMMSFPLLKAMGLMINANKKSGMARIAEMMHKDAAWLERTAQANSLLLEEILILAGNDTEDYFLLKKEPRQTAGLRQGGAA